VSDTPPNDHEHAPHGREDNEDGIEQFLKRFAARELRLIMWVTIWIFFVAFVAIGIEVLVTVLDDFPKLAFVRNTFDMLGKLALICDATVFSVFLLVATLTAVHRLLKLIGIDVLAVLKWIWTKILSRVK